MFIHGQTKTRHISRPNCRDLQKQIAEVEVVSQNYVVTYPCAFLSGNAEILEYHVDYTTAYTLIFDITYAFLLFQAYSAISSLQWL